MRDFSARPSAMAISLWNNRALIFASAKREVLGRYRGSVLGLFWSFFNPLFMLAVYTFVFSVVFKARWTSASDSKAEFALVLFAGLIVFNLFAECVNRAPGLIVYNTNYVKRVVFPLEILSFVSLSSALYHALISLAVWIIAYAVLIGVPHLTILFLPLILAPLCMLIVGLSWILASLGVFLRDVSQFVGILTSVLMFLSPIFYPASSLPQKYQNLLYLNPLTPEIEMARQVLYWGQAPSLTLLGLYYLFSAAICWLGFFWFQRTRKGFADVL